MNNYFNRVFAVLFAAILLILLVAAGLYLNRDAPHEVDLSADAPLSAAYPKTSSVREPTAEPPVEENETLPEPTVATNDVPVEKAVETVKGVERMPSPGSLPAELPDVPGSPFGDAPGLIKQESFRIDPPMRDVGNAWIDDTGREDFSIPITGGGSLAIKVERFEAIGRDGGEFIGSVKGRPGSSVKLSYRGSSEAGMIRIPTEDRLFLYLPGQEGQVVVQERDLSMAEGANQGVPSNMEIPPPPNFIPPPPPDINQLDPPLPD